MQAEHRYASCLLRLWQVRNDRQTTWVASLQCAATGDRRVFASVDVLAQFFQSEFGEVAAPDHDDRLDHSDQSE